MKAAIRKAGCVLWIALFTFLNAISDARSRSTGSIRVNENAAVFAAELTQEGHFIADDKGAWREHRPSADAENEFIRLHGFSEYAKWHLGVDERYPANTKRRYKFPYGDFTNVHRCALLAVKARANQYGYTEIANTADHLLKRAASRQER